MPPQSSGRFVCLDTETSGFAIAEGHRVIEIGCVEIADRSRSSREFHSYFNPDCDIEQGAYRVHGLSREFLADQPVFADRFDEFADFIFGSTLLIHNADFDANFLDSELRRIKKPPLAELCDGIVDTLELARSMHVGVRNSLDALCERYNINRSEREEGHGALVDAQLLARVYLAMTRRQQGMDIASDNSASSGRWTQGLEQMGQGLPVRRAGVAETRAHADYFAEARRLREIS